MKPAFEGLEASFGILCNSCSVAQTKRDVKQVDVCQGFPTELTPRVCLVASSEFSESECTELGHQSGGSFYMFHDHFVTLFFLIICNMTPRFFDSKKCSHNSQRLNGNVFLQTYSRTGCTRKLLVMEHLSYHLNLENQVKIFLQVPFSTHKENVVDFWKVHYTIYISPRNWS